jgi:CubicO group peptidase (beta-lactamase class C family)
MEGFVHPDFAPVTEKVHTLMSKRSALGGMAVAVYHRGELVVDAWTGVRDASGTPWDRDTMSMSFSTTKGVVATIVHRLVDQGLLDYDVPVARYWPEFAAGGKDAITLRHLLTHQAALHDVRALAESTETLLDWDEMTRLLAAAGPAWEVGTRSGYHALTYGWLVGELIRRVTGLTVNQALQREIVEPLGLDGQMYIGAPPDVATASPRCWSTRRHQSDCCICCDGSRVSIGMRRCTRRWWSTTSWTSARPNGFTTPRSRLQTGCSPLARSRGCTRALATPDAFDGPPLLTAETLREATREQPVLGAAGTGLGSDLSKVGRDAAVMINMHWRLGYHLAGTTSGVLPKAFGHFGFGGSGAWGDPESGLAVAMILNQVGGTPFGDTKMLRIGGAAVRAAKRRATA